MGYTPQARPASARLTLSAHPCSAYLALQAEASLRPLRRAACLDRRPCGLESTVATAAIERSTPRPH